MRQLNAVIDGDTIGLGPAEEAALGRAASRHAPDFAEAYLDLWRAAALGLPGWPAPWPQRLSPPLSWDTARGLAGEAVADLGCPARAAALLAAGRLRQSDRSCAIARPGVAPLALVAFDGRASGASLAAHELAHAAQMWAGPWASRPAPPLAAAEAHAHAGEALAHARLARRAPMAAALVGLDVRAAMLLRHPARACGAVWGAIAPRLGWTGPVTPAGRRAFGCALGAALGFLAGERMRRGCARFRRAYMEWADQGPKARVAELADMLGARPDDPDLYAAAYHQACGLAKAAKEL